MIARYALALGLGAAVTFALFFIMQLLIATGRGALTEAATFRVSDFIMVEQNIDIETRERRPEKPPEPELPPEVPQPSAADNFDNSMIVSMASPTIDTNLNVGGVGFGVSDGEYLPIVKVAPVYPARALRMGLEGYCVVEFTVQPNGATRDAFEVECSNSVFLRASLAAALKFKYKPRVIDAVAVEVPGVQNRITYALEDDGF
jgi:protein TonB